VVTDQFILYTVHGLLIKKQADRTEGNREKEGFCIVDED
jgi:hypothetical protein